MSTLRVLSYNVRSLRDDADAVGRVIRQCTADVVCVQEAPRFLRWRSKSAALARRADLLVAAGGRPACGNLLLCHLSVDVLSTATIALSRRRGRQRRAAAVAVCARGGRRFALVGTHLDLDPADRLRHVDEILARLSGSVGDDTLPVILAGDINEGPGEPAFAALASQRQDAFAVAGEGLGATFPARAPDRRIDAVFVEGGLRVVSCDVIDTPDVAVASDHRPVIAEIDLGSTS